jgi:hypothetical protein
MIRYLITSMLDALVSIVIGTQERDRKKERNLVKSTEVRFDLV